MLPTRLGKTTVSPCVSPHNNEVFIAPADTRHRPHATPSSRGSSLPAGIRRPSTVACSATSPTLPSARPLSLPWWAKSSWSRRVLEGFDVTGAAPYHHTPRPHRPTPPYPKP